MLEIRPSCEHCDKDLPYNSTDAMICTIECTFCSECVNDIFANICPNCGGNFEKRPIRPAVKLEKHRPSAKRIFNPKELKKNSKEV